MMSSPFAHLASAALSDVGRKRGNNEDSFGSFPTHGAWCVADGMGGGDDGEVASAAVIRAVENFCNNNPMPASGAYSGADIAKGLVSAVNTASAWIYSRAKSKNLRGCGSTFVGVAFDAANPSKALALHAGDSRLYRIRGRDIKQITRDHSAAELIGAKNEDEVNPMFRGMILRAVGIQRTVEVDITPFDVKPDDIVLICSDGLSKMIPDKRIAEIVRKSDGAVKSAVKALVDAANEAGGYDNVTVELIRVGKLPQSSPTVGLKLKEVSINGANDTVETGGGTISKDTLDSTGGEALPTIGTVDTPTAGTLDAPTAGTLDAPTAGTLDTPFGSTVGDSSKGGISRWMVVGIVLLILVVAAVLMTLVSDGDSKQTDTISRQGESVEIVKEPDQIVEVASDVVEPSNVVETIVAIEPTNVIEAVTATNMAVNTVEDAKADDAASAADEERIKAEVAKKMKELEAARNLELQQAEEKESQERAEREKNERLRREQELEQAKQQAKKEQEEKDREMIRLKKNEAVSCLKDCLSDFSIFVTENLRNRNRLNWPFDNVKQWDVARQEFEKSVLGTQESLDCAKKFVVESQKIIPRLSDDLQLRIENGNIYKGEKLNKVTKFKKACDRLGKSDADDMEVWKLCAEWIKIGARIKL